MNDLARVHIWVKGHVQGVGFRAFVLHVGSSYGLVGWVRNVGYDQVETVAEGARSILEHFIEVVNQGPRASHVDSSQVEWESSLGEFDRFSVR